MQDVHTCSRLGVPSTVACTTWMLGFQRRGVRRCEWETLLPKPGPLPQMSQTEATGSLHCVLMIGCASRRPGAGPGNGRPRPDAGTVVEGYPMHRLWGEPTLAVAAYPEGPWPAWMNRYAMCSAVRPPPNWTRRWACAPVATCCGTTRGGMASGAS